MCQQYLFKTQGVTGTQKTVPNTVSIHQHREQRNHTSFSAGSQNALILFTSAAWQLKYITCSTDTPVGKIHRSADRREGAESLKFQS